MLGLCRTKTLKVLEAHMAQQLTNIRLDLRKLENGAALHCRSHECLKVLTFGMLYGFRINRVLQV